MDEGLFEEPKILAHKPSEILLVCGAYHDINSLYLQETIITGVRTFTV